MGYQIEEIDEFTTDLGSLIGNIQCGNFLDSSVSQILREINNGHFESTQNCHFVHLSSCEFYIFDIFKCETFQKLNFKASKMVKMAGFDPVKSAKLISRKIPLAGKL